VSVRKVVINRCFGGFGLSWPAMQRYAERKGLVASYFPLSADTHRTVYGATPVDPAIHSVAIVVGPHAVADWPDLTDAFVVHHADIPRDDADLVAVVEELGSEAASGQCARLSVASVPADVQWTIEEYDGREWIAEQHRTWR
jgi:hypothetical protein